MLRHVLGRWRNTRISSVILERLKISLYPEWKSSYVNGKPDSRLAHVCQFSRLFLTMGIQVCKCKKDEDSQLKEDKMPDMVEQVLCGVDEMKDNEMKEFTMDGGGRVLLIKENGEFSALGAKCTHYGAPLAKGVLCNGTVRCPWHAACFNAKTGDIEDFPGMDSLPKFQVNVENCKVKVKADRKLMESSARQKPMCRRDPSNCTTYVVVGSGAAAASFVETLRQENFTGRIVMVTKECYPPYDRPMLSKGFTSDIGKIALRSVEFYTKYDIELIKQTEVVGLDCGNKNLCLADGSCMKYDKVLVATGGIPRKLNVPGCDLKNVAVLRSIDDAAKVLQAAQGKNIIIVGLSFIGMEAAASLVDKASSVTVVGPSGLPFLPVLGEKIATRLKKVFEKKGIKFSDGRSVKEFVGDNGLLKEVILENGEKLSADFCLLGIGVNPGTDFLKTSGVQLTPEGYLVVDKCMQTNLDGVYGAGDITRFPLFIANDTSVNIQHWQMAHKQGRVAALTMLGKGCEIRSVPYFWTMFFGMGIRFAGYGVGYDDVVISGNLEDLQFVAYYTKSDKVVAVVAMKNDPVASMFAELLRSGQTLTKAEVMSADPNAWKTRICCRT